MPIHGNTITVDTALTVDTDAYTAGDVVGGLIEFEVGSPGGGGVVRSVILVDDAAQSEPYKLYLFDTEPSAIADDAAFAPTIADLKKLVGIIDIVAGDYVTLNSNVIAIRTGLSIDYVCSTGILFAYLVAVDTPDYAAAADLTLRVTVWAN
jgi:hypothetical protein